ncbi:hypothetical protein EK21DRAFT_70725 [Setomelanomma holmii]|uniref:Peptidase A1 domain-containing protein n=1 Tax=Setomelanomma holmii TaxID=210430 RepID=A0A9P4H5D7_9PLEO|nr:hypothetical protein EK21DRAFT_70725 [Setomelanomma holmii]
MLSIYRTLVATFFTTVPLAIAQGNSLSVFPQTIFLPWIAPFSGPSTYTPSVRGSIFGTNFNFSIDTGSPGVLISSSLLLTVKLSSKNPTGWKFLDSSDILYNGRFVDLNITFCGSNGERAISRVPVLVVTSIVKCPGYDVFKGNGVCPPEKLERQWSQIRRTVLYMGVGFGRNVPGSGIPYGTPDHNPLINVIAPSKYKQLFLRQGYTISTKGVCLGLAGVNTNGVVWQKLEKMAGPDLRAWAPPLVSFTHDNSNNPVQAQALIDTGITQMYIQSTPGLPLPNVTTKDPSPLPGTITRVKSGTKLVFAFPDFKKGVAGYDFVVGDTAFPSQPRYVQPVTSGSGPFVNTGRNFLYGFSIVFDAIAGRFGFIFAQCK